MQAAHQGDYPRALECFQAVLHHHSSHVQAANNVAVMLAELGRHSEAVAAYDHALLIDPKFVDAIYNRANAYRELGQLDIALAEYDRVLRLKPGFAAAHTNKAVCQLSLGLALEAAKGFSAALELDARSASAWNGLGLTKLHLGQFDEAVACCRRALELEPTLAEAHYNLGLLYLLLGDFRSGWPEYEYRWRLAEHVPRPFAQPQWEGQDLAGRAIYLHAEQGLGDTIQFIRFAPLLKARGAYVIAEVQPQLQTLLSRCDGVDRWGSARELSGLHFDYHCPLLSVGRHLVATSGDIPSSVPYVHVEPARINRWRDALDKFQGFKIGIAWQGSKNYRWDVFRSVGLKSFDVLALIPGVDWISLQQGASVQELAATRLPIIDLASTLDLEGNAFVDTAAVIESLDLVITCDTAIGHLAGALACPTWVVLPVGSDWRWHLPGEISPWYPTMRLFRQDQFQQWDSVFESLRTSLLQHVSDR